LWYDFQLGIGQMCCCLGKGCNIPIPSYRILCSGDINLFATRNLENGSDEKVPNMAPKVSGNKSKAPKALHRPRSLEVMANKAK
jgi:hypothetical protein